ncbi:hypothetical protein [Croceicoccus mobilis]|uniref:Uncharacterized protein n=1 Tax=Croceicoccus mobilis TaxID=1703339 RepID=A0A917DTB0_9SPHN|nr:hypothetical protein [Croceicoccus mobilis]GGD64633.1 hypothetical protein GCM10010990_12660 [Croceicoccus mobilis]
MSYFDGLRGHALLAVVAFAAITRPQPSHAEVALLTDDMFVVRHTGIVGADVRVSWDALLSPADWWSGAHSFSGDAANFVLDPRAGGCFCEVLPVDGERAEPGSVKHLEVVFVDPGKAMRLVGALGPLQSEPVRGVLTVTLKPVENGTRILFEYAVGGPSRFDQNTIAPAVDRVIADQMSRLVDRLGEAGADIDARAIPSFEPEPSVPASADTGGSAVAPSGEQSETRAFGAETRAIPAIIEERETPIDGAGDDTQADAATPDDEAGGIGSDFLSR